MKTLPRCCRCSRDLTSQNTWRTCLMLTETLANDCVDQCMQVPGLIISTYMLHVTVNLELCHLSCDEILHRPVLIAGEECEDVF